MDERWIGVEDDTSGSYKTTAFDELSRRYGGKFDVKLLYRFESRFGREYNITDTEVIAVIEVFLKEDKISELIDYLYRLVIDKFGMLEILHDIELRTARERDEGYRKGRFYIQKEIQEVLGIGNNNGMTW